MAEIDFEAVSDSDASDAEALAFRIYMLALRAHRARKALLSKQSLISATDELTQQTLPNRLSDVAQAVAHPKQSS